ncbi:MAG: hypothetical protein D6729_04850 [Deltaproteobacteria bacterium]|nr:MAG: hypothetical protein D6729_04850 [Deltaproteobacteria bacterium]
MATATRELGRRRRAADLVGFLWHGFAQPRRLVWLLGLFASGLALAAYAHSDTGRHALLRYARKSPVFERLYSFLELNDPLHGWWLVLLGTATALALLATLVEHRGRLVAWLRGSDTPRPLTKRSPVEAARRAARRLGEAAEVGASPEGLEIVLPSRALRAGTAAVGIGALLVVVGLLAELFFGLAGEMLLRPGEVVDRVQVPGPGGAPSARPAGAHFELVDIDEAGEALRVRVDGEVHRLPMGRPSVVAGLRLTPRLLRLAAGGERFTLRAKRRSEPVQEVEETVGVGEVVRLPDGTQVALVGFSLDAHGLGPAVRLEIQPPEGPVDGTWIFSRYPDFDAQNRGGRWGLSLEAIERPKEAIVAVVRHPGRWFFIAAGLVLLTGAVLLFLGARGTRAVVIDGRGVRATPPGDDEVRAAADAAVSR